MATPWIKRKFFDDEIDVFERVKRAVLALPDGLDLGKKRTGEVMILSCHVLANAVGKVFDLEVVNGYFSFPSFNHSWCKTRKGNIIDVYPISVFPGHSISPILFYAERMATPWSCLYHPRTKRDFRISTGSGASGPYFKQAVEVVAEALRRASQ